MRILFFVFALVFVNVSFAQDSARTADTLVVDSAKTDTAKTYIVEINRLLQKAESQLGTPYRWAGKLPGGFDCSGFVLYCYKSTLGIALPASATEYPHYGKAVSRQNARPGDVICFTGYYANTTVIGHVGIITEVTPTDIYFIHSASSYGVRHDKLSGAYYTARFLGIRRILN
jgi:cell wall-associated NlpC family hydrolase